MKGNYHKKTSPFGGWTRYELWSYGNRRGLRKRIKTWENRKYRRTQRNIELDNQALYFS